MKFKKLFLIGILGILFSLNITSVRAECYKICFQGDCSYSAHSNQVDIDSYSKCLKGAYKNPAICDDQLSTSKVDDWYCNDGSSNYEEGQLVSCGNKLVTDIPKNIPRIIHVVYLILQILVPILLVIFGSIDFLKAVVAQKDDEIKKGQQIFIKRAIAGLLVFFVFSIVKIVISFAGNDNKNNIKRILNCSSCLINNNDKCEVVK